MTVSRVQMDRLCGSSKVGQATAEPLWIHASCHIGSRLHAFYDKDFGELTILCAECQKPVIVVEVK